MDKLATIYVMFNVIYSTLFIIFVCGNEAFMTPWWVTLIAAIVPAVLTLIGSLTISKRLQLRKNTEEIKKLARQLGVNDEKTFHSEFSEQYSEILSEIQDNIGKTPNDKALTGQHQDMLNILQKDFQVINGRYEKEDESYRKFTAQQLDLKETLDNFSRDYAKVIGLNAKLFNETIALKNEIDKLKAANKELRSELSKGKDMGHGNSLHM